MIGEFSVKLACSAPAEAGLCIESRSLQSVHHDLATLFGSLRQRRHRLACHPDRFTEPGAQGDREPRLRRPSFTYNAR